MPASSAPNRAVRLLVSWTGARLDILDLRVNGEDMDLTPNGQRDAPTASFPVSASPAEDGGYTVIGRIGSLNGPAKDIEVHLTDTGDVKHPVVSDLSLDTGDDPLHFKKTIFL